MFDFDVFSNPPSSGWSYPPEYPDLPPQVEAILSGHWPHDDVCHTKGCPGVGFCASAHSCDSRECDCTRLSVALVAEQITQLDEGHLCPPGKVVKKFDGGRVALLCATCQVIVGWENW